MSDLPSCPECHSQFTYENRGFWACPECGHEWSDASSQDDASGVRARDANGNPLADGDSVTVVKDLKIKGSSGVVKIGTKIKINRIVDGDHNIDCKIDGIGAMMLKSEFVKKIS